MAPPVPRRRRRRVIQDVNGENAENIPILTTEQVDALNAELTPDGAARKVRKFYLIRSTC